MGASKAWLDFGGEPLLTRVVRTLLPEFREVIVVGRSGQELPDCGALRVNDDPERAGPLVGIAAGLAAITTETAWITACDSPFPCLPLIRRLFDLQGSAIVVVPRWAGRLQPLHAGYRRCSLAAADELLRHGVVKPMALLDRVACRIVEPAEFLDLDPDGLSFLNTNTEADYRLAIAALTSGQQRQSRCPPTDEATSPSR